MTAAYHANTVREDHLCPVDEYGDVLPDCLVCAALDALLAQAETAERLADELASAYDDRFRKCQHCGRRIRGSQLTLAVDPWDGKKKLVCLDADSCAAARGGAR